ncbi:MAG: FAD-binding protein, partial [Flavobacteriaceae bacterium]|nr:FAD-binding protein [Flavobacteriaceae bacterium]
LEINAEEKWIRVQPGVVRDELNEFLKPYGLFFGPNTSTANRCNIGGMVGNNSCGSTSIVYRSTRDHVLELKTILSDGSEVVFKALDRQQYELKKKGKSLESQLYKEIDKMLSEKQNQEHIKQNYPKASIQRRNTGYALDVLLQSDPFSQSEAPFNFCKLLCGSEGTLAFTTEIKLNLVDAPKPEVVVLAAHFESIDECLKATVLAMNHNPTACELMDKHILDCTKDNIEQQKNRFFVSGDPAAILLIEFREDDTHESAKKAADLKKDLENQGLGYAYKVISGQHTDRVWDLRKAGLGLLGNIPGDKKAVACIEDTAVELVDLPAYIAEFSEMMTSFGQEAVYYAHAGDGELHLRPILNLKDSADVKDFRAISRSSAELVKKYRGSLSGEHGDGRVRSEFIPFVLGDAVYQLLKEVKTSWDPQHILNPGKIVDAKPMEKDLRYEPDVPTPEFNTAFNFDDTGGILRTVEKCNGSGDCRKLNFAGGTMCPSYRATLDEKDSTRGRANVLREFLTQNVNDNPFDHPEIKTAMDLCISCKGCKSECPSNVDMATLKSEFLYQYYKTHKIPLRSKLIGRIGKLNTKAMNFPGISNMIMNQNWLKAFVGISKNRSLPKLQPKSLRQWYKGYQQQASKNKLYLFCDEYSNYYDVDIGIKTIKLLNRLGYEVLMPNHEESGRAYISKGLLDDAKGIAEINVRSFSKLLTDKTPLVGIEPSAILSFRDEYPNLVDRKLRQTALNLSEKVFLIDEFLKQEIDKGHVNASVFSTEKKEILLHGHCHQKALSSIDITAEILSLPKNYMVEIIPSGCCGMAGSFGYEKEHYDLSMRIGEQVLFPKLRASENEQLIAAAGTSCRHQILDGTGKKAKHPVEILFDAMI